ncbi:MAG: putative major facilitator superfamily transporter [Frankiales bacterium]|nr:putative major facilitator superfamily transporter [Frankiales bacterium]
MDRSLLLRAPQFRRLFAGQAVSTLGDRLVMVAMPFAVLTVPGAGLSDVGLVLGSSALALALFVLVGGVWADRLPRHRTMLASDVVRALAQGSAAALLLTGSATVAALVLTQAVYGGAEAFFRPAVLGLVPQLVEPGQEQPANALLALTDNTSMVLGPALAGLLVATAGPGTALAVDAGTFLVSAGALAGLRPRPAAPGPRQPFLVELAAGWHEVRSRTWVWSVIGLFGTYCALVLPALFVLGPAHAESARGGASSWGVICTGFGVGAVCGSLVALRWRPHRPGAVLTALLAVGALQAVVVVAPLPTAVVAALEGVTGLAVALGFALWDTALQEQVPPAAHSRVSSFDHLGSLTLVPLGYAAVGPVAERVGEVPTAVTATVVTAAVALAVACSREVRSLERLPAARRPPDLPAVPLVV